MVGRGNSVNIIAISLLSIILVSGFSFSSNSLSELALTPAYGAVHLPGEQRIENYIGSIGADATAAEIKAALISPSASAFCEVISLPVDGISLVVETASSQSFPSAGSSYIIISTGSAADVGNGTSIATNFLASSNGNPDGLAFPADVQDGFGDSANDVANFSIECDIPSTATILSFDWTFGSDEEPTFTPNDFSDFFRTNGTLGNIVLLPNGNVVTANNMDLSTHENPVTGTSGVPTAPFPSPDDTALNAVVCTGTATVACDQPVTTSIDVTSYQGTTITIGFQVADDTDTTIDSAAYIDNFDIQVNTPPVLSANPADVTVEPDAVPTAPTLTATDAEDEPDPAVTFTQTRVGVVGEGDWVLTRTWLTTDSGGLFDSHTQTVTVEDNTAPELVGTPTTPITVEPNLVPAVPTVTATDNNPEDSTPTPVTFTQTRVGAVGEGDWVLTRTWSVTDASGNDAVFIQIINVVDTILPTFTVVPSNDRLQAGLITQTADFTFTVTATDNNPEASPKINCTDEDSVSVVSNADGTATPTYTSKKGINTISCSATDPSGNNTNAPTFDLIASLITLNAILDTKWNDPLATGGIAYGFLEHEVEAVLVGETIKVTYGTDGTDSQVIPIGIGSNPDTGFTWTSSHTFPKSTSSSIQGIKVELIENPTRATSATQNIEILKHPTAFTGLNTIATDFPSILWGDTVIKSGVLTDTFANSGVNPALVRISGDGLGVIPFDAFTDTSGAFSESLLTISTTATGVKITVGYSAVTNNVENQFYLPATSVNDSFNTKIHPTQLNLEIIDSVDGGFDVNILGSLIDTHTNTGVHGKTITYATTTPVGIVPPFSISDKTTLQPITFLPGKDSALVVDSCPLCTEGSSVLRLIPGDYIELPDNPRYVILSLEDMGADVLTVLVTPASIEAKPFKLEGKGKDKDVGAFLIGTPSGVHRIDVISATAKGGDEAVVLGDTATEGVVVVGAISKIQTLNVKSAQLFASNFDDELSPGKSIVFADGFVGGLETTPEDFSFPEEFTVSSSFASGDPEYTFDDSVTRTFVTTFQPGNLGGGIGGVTAVNDDSGIGITSVICANDEDSDAICDSWEERDDLGALIPDNGVPYVVDGVTYKYPLVGTALDDPNVLAEIDYHVDHKPIQSALDDIAGNYTINGITLIQEVNDEITPHLDLLNVWNDDDTDFTNDFNSIKTQKFGKITERVNVTGTQTIGFVNNVVVIPVESLTLEFDDDILDSSGNGVIGTISDATTSFVTGHVGTSAFDFLGVRYITHDSATDFAFDSTDPFSFSYWIKSDAQTGWIVTKTDSGFHGYINYLRTTGNPSLFLYGTDGVYVEKAMNTDITDGTYRHIAVTYDGSGTANGINFYVDGVLDTNTTIYSNGPSLTAPILNDGLLTVGAGNAGINTINAAIDDLRIHSTKLTTSQVNGLFNAVGDPSLHYTFDDNVLDSSSNGITGTISDATTSFVTGQIGTSAFDFAGLRYITTSDTEFNFDSTDPFSFSYWIKSDAQTGWIVTKTDSGFHGYINYLRTTGNPSLFIYDTDGIFVEKAMNTDITDGTYRHIAVTYDGSGTADGINFYVDGVLDTNTSNFGSASLTASILNDGLLTIGAHESGAFKVNAVIDDLRVHDFELKLGAVATLFNPPTGETDNVIISGLSLGTPENSDTGDQTEGRIVIKALITTDSDATVGYDVSNAITIAGASSLITFDSPTAIVTPTLVGNEKILKVTIPYRTSDNVNLASLGTITVPLDSDTDISSGTPPATLPGSPIATSTLLEAKAQAYRYVLFTHSIGGSSGQAELRGNDAIVALGDGFTETNSGHIGTEGSVKEQAGTLMHEYGHLLNLEHNGPAYDIDFPEITLISSVQNCVPTHKSVMSYTGQLPAYLLGQWKLDYSDLDGFPLNEATLPAGIAITDSPFMVWATPTLAALQSFQSGFADGSALDWDGDGDEDGFDTGSTQDLNNFGFSGCQASADSEFIEVSEWGNLDFDFRQGPTGQFDASVALYPDGQDELTVVQTGQLKTITSEHTIFPPSVKKKDKDPGLFNAGSNVHFQFDFFESDFTTPLRFEIVNAFVIQEGCETAAQGCPDGIYLDLGPMNNKPDGEKPEHYTVNWKTLETDLGTFGVNFVVSNPDATITEFILLDDNFAEGLVFPEVNEEEVTVKFVLQDGGKGKGKDKNDNAGNGNK